MTKLDGLLSGSDSHNASDSDEELDIQSQAGDLEDRESSPIATMESQCGFATQVPGRVGNVSFQPTVAAKGPSFNKGADFISLLNVSKGMEVAAVSSGKGANSTTISRSSVNAQTMSVLQPLSEARKAEMSSRLDSKANSQSSLTSSGSKNHAPPPKESNLPPSNSIPSDDSEKENSQESLKRDNISIPVARFEEIEPVAEAEQQGVSELLIAHIPEGNPFEGMKRVPRSYVRIPANQQALLDSKDSWWQPETGSRSSYANVPQEIVQDLNAHLDRRQSGRKPHGIDQMESTAAGASTETDEASERDEEAYEDDASEKADTEEILCLSNESKVIPQDDARSDEESVHTWLKSQGGDLEPDEFEAAPGLSLEDIGPLELSHYNTTGMAINPPSAQKSSSPSPPISNMPAPAKLKPRIDYNFPSSSPGDEEELEIVVPYAIDDEVDEIHAEIGEEPETSQELPSTSVANQAVVQVEQTPGHNEAQELDNGKSLDLELYTRAFIHANEANNNISSDPIIPATFEDPSSQERLLLPKRGHPASSDKRSLSTIFSAEDQPHTLQKDDSMLRAHDVIHEEDDMAQEQLFTEMKPLQRERSEPIDSSLPSSPPHESSKSPIQATPQRNKMPQDASPYLHSPQQFTSSSFNTTLSEMRSENEKPHSAKSSPLKEAYLKRGSEGTQQTEVRKLKLSRSVRSRAVAASQTDPDFRDTTDWTKSARHEFHARHSSPIEEPVVQIAQSQPKSPTTKQASLARPSADAVFPQSPHDFVRSSIPERTEEAPVTGKNSKAKAEIPREQSSPSILERLQPLSETKIATSPRLRRMLLLESLELANDLNMAQAVAENPNLGSFGSPDELELEENELHPEANVEILSISSEEDLVDDEEPAEEYEFAGEEVLAEEEQLANEEQRALSEVSQERDPSPTPTVFQRFKSIYPGYSGSEKDIVWALVYIEWLVETKGEDFLRASLWDDFIRTLAVEYPEYIREVRYSGDKIRTGFAYFNKLDKAPIFRQRIMTPENLQDSILTLNPKQVEKVRLQFSKSTSPLADPSRPESSHALPSVASKHPQTHQTKGKSVGITLHGVVGPPDSNIVPDARLSRVPGGAIKKRPFFETPSQLQAAKKHRTSDTPREQETNVEVPRTSKSRRSFPYAQANSPQTSTTPSLAPQSKASTSAPTSTSRINATTQRPEEKRRFTTSTSFNGCSGSPAVGEPERTSRSFSAIDSRAGSIGLSPSNRGLFKKPSAPVSKAALQQQRNLVRSRAGKVEGWLDNTEQDDGQGPEHPLHGPKPLHQKESIKRKRGSGLELLDITTPDSKPKSRRVASVPANETASSSTSRTSDVGLGGREVGKKTSFRDFLKKRRESAKGSKPSTPESKAGASRSRKEVERTPVQHSEPETQAWGV